MLVDAENEQAARDYVAAGNYGSTEPQPHPYEPMKTPPAIAARFPGLDLGLTESQQAANTAADMGVVEKPEKGLPPSMRAALSFAPTDEYRGDILRKAGYDARANPQTGELEFLNTASKDAKGEPRWVRANEVGLSLGDIVAAVPDGLKLAGDAAGNITAGLAAEGTGGGGAALFRSMGSAGGTYSTEMMRLSLGKALGYHNLTVPEMHDLAWSEAKTAAAGSLVGEGIGQVFHYVRNPTGGLTDENLRAANAEIAAADPAIRKVQSETGMPFHPFTGQVSNDIGLLNLQADLQRNPRFLRQMNDIKTGNWGALMKYYDNYISKWYHNFDDTRASVGDAVKRSMNNIGNHDQALDREAAQMAKDDAARALANLPTQQDTSLMGQSARDVILQASRGGQAAIDNAETALNKSIGFRPSDQSSRVKVSATPELVRIAKGISAAGEKEISGDNARFFNKILGDSAKAWAETPIKNAGTISMDVVQVNNAITALENASRGMPAGVKRDAIDELRYALEDARHKSLKNSSVLTDIENLDQMRRDQYMKFSRGIVGDILQEAKAGGYKLRDSDVMRRIWQDDNPAAINELAQILRNEPTAYQQMQNSIYAEYRKSATKNGLLDQAKHDAFVRDHENMINNFGLGDKMDRLGKFDLEVQRTNKELADATTAMANGTHGKLSRISSDDLTKKTLDGTLSTEDINFTVRKLTDYSRRGLPTAEGALQSWRASVMDEIKHRISTKNGNEFNSEAISDLLHNGGERLRALFGTVDGPQYIADLEQLRHLTQMLEREGSVQRVDPRLNLLRKLINVPIAPLGRENRLVTFTRTGRGFMQQRAMFDIVTDPDKLHILLQNKAAHPGRQQVRSLLASVGALSLLDGNGNE